MSKHSTTFNRYCCYTILIGMIVAPILSALPIFLLFDRGEKLTGLEVIFLIICLSLSFIFFFYIFILVSWFVTILLLKTLGRNSDQVLDFYLEIKRSHDSENNKYSKSNWLITSLAKVFHGKGILRIKRKIVEIFYGKIDWENKNDR